MSLLYFQLGKLWKMVSCFSSSFTLESQYCLAQFFENKVHPYETPYTKTCRSQHLQPSHLHNYGVSTPLIIIQQKIYSQNFKATNRKGRKGRKAVRKWVSRAGVYWGHELLRTTCSVVLLRHKADKKPEGKSTSQSQAIQFAPKHQENQNWWYVTWSNSSKAHFFCPCAV